MSRPKPLDPLRPRDLLSPSHGNVSSPDAGPSLAHLASTLSAHGAGAFSEDLALDLVLHHIAEEARLATNASGAAIALVRGQEIVCRATTGTSAPGLGLRLDTRAGLSGACVQTGMPQCCEDSETDSRVDAAVCRRLGIRAILVFPVFHDDRFLGVIEVFSPRSHAFHDRDVQTLQAFSFRIVSSLQATLGLSSASEEVVDEVVDDVPTPPPLPELAAPAFDLPLLTATNPARDSDPWTRVLVGIVAMLSLVVCAMIGTILWQKYTPPSQTPRRITASAAKQGSVPAPSTTASSPPAGANPAKPQAGPGSTNDLVVYENGKVVFRIPPNQRPQSSSTLPPQAAAATKQADANHAVSIAPDVALEYLVERVEPQYPQLARERHIQGAVVLQATVGKDGNVHELTTISGDPQLVGAARDAVLQWRFQPFFRDGEPSDFQTRITVDFTLP